MKYEPNFQNSLKLDILIVNYILEVIYILLVLALIDNVILVKKSHFLLLISLSYFVLSNFIRIKLMNYSTKSLIPLD